MKKEVPGLTIRPLALKDLNPVYRLGLDENIAASSALPWDARSLAEVFSLDGTLAFTAARKKEIAGFAVASVRENTSELLWILVKTKFRNRGIGRALLDSIIGALVQNGISSFSISIFPERDELENFFCKKLDMKKESYTRLSKKL